MRSIREGREEELPRSDEAAWSMALNNQGLLYSILFEILRTVHVPWYPGENLRPELEGLMWERFYKACKVWDPARSRFTTYVVPALRNAAYEGIRQVSRMGGNVKGSFGGAMKPPPIDSIDQSPTLTGDDGGASEVSFEDLYQPWGPGAEEFEDRLVNELYARDVLEAVQEIVSRMSEPHRQVFELIHLVEPSDVVREVNSRRGKGLTLDETAAKLERSNAFVWSTLREAEEYVRLQLRARGYDGDDEEEISSQA
jgi:DNA-directed RNA polymerase specialized sigma24 family protein